LKGREETEGWQANQKVYVRIEGYCDLEGTKDLVDTAVAENLSGTAAILFECVGMGGNWE